MLIRFRGLAGTARILASKFGAFACGSVTANHRNECSLPVPEAPRAATTCASRMESLESRNDVSCTAPAASSSQAEHDSCQDAASDGHHLASTRNQQVSEAPMRHMATRPRRARPGGHFQAPHPSPRAPLADCNTLFMPSTLQASHGSSPIKSETTNTPSLTRKQVPRSDACVGSQWHQRTQNDGAELHSEKHVSLENASTFNNLSVDQLANTALTEARGQRSANGSTRTPPNRVGVPKSRPEGLSSGGPLLPSALYLKILRQMNAAPSGKRMSAAGRNGDIILKGAPSLKIFCGTWYAAHYFCIFCRSVCEYSCISI